MFPSDTRLHARGLLLAVRLELRQWPEAETLHRAPLAISLPGGGLAVLFRHGVAVLFGTTTETEAALRERLRPLMERPYDSIDTEQLEVRIEPVGREGLREGALVVQSGSLERMLLVAEALSKSLVLGHYEARLARDFDRIERFALQLERTGGIRGTREHVKRIGALLLIESRMVGRAEIGDKPELLWDHPDLEGLNALLEDEFEIRERLAALDRKLELVARTERTLADLISTRHALRVEWYIVALIVIEIALTVYDLWVA